MKWIPKRYTKKKFTQEQLEKVSNIDLAHMLQKQGEKLKKEGRVYRWMRYDSTVIYHNKWYRHSRGIGGGPIQFMQHFYGMNFVESVKYLLNGEEGINLVQTSVSNEKKSELVIPKLSKNMHRTFAYLIKTRRIDAEVVRHFVREKKIFETLDYHNIAFCGYDENGQIKQIHLRSTRPGKRFFNDVEGSDKQYYFRHVGKDNEVYVFEAPIDMLSFITMNKDGWEKHSYVCLGGVAIDSLKHILKTNKNITKVFLCLDHDEVGNKTVRRIGNELDIQGVCWERLTPEHKDWNDDLIAYAEREKLDMTMKGGW